MRSPLSRDLLARHPHRRLAPERTRPFCAPVMYNSSAFRWITVPKLNKNGVCFTVSLNAPGCAAGGALEVVNHPTAAPSVNWWTRLGFPEVALEKTQVASKPSVPVVQRKSKPSRFDASCGVRRLSQVTSDVVRHLKKHGGMLPKEKHVFGRRAYDALNVLTGLGLLEGCSTKHAVRLSPMGRAFFGAQMSHTARSAAARKNGRRGTRGPDRQIMEGSKLALLTARVWGVLVSHMDSPICLGSLINITHSKQTDDDKKTTMRRVYDIMNVLRQVGCVASVDAAETSTADGARYNKVYKITAKGRLLQNLRL